VFKTCSDFDYPAALCRWLALVLISCPVTLIHAQATNESISVGENTLTGTQQAVSGTPTPRPILTDSPRNTLTSFLRLRDELEQALRSYWSGPSPELAEQVKEIQSNFIELLNLSAVPRKSRREVGVDTTAYLLDILGRVELPDLESIPQEEPFGGDELPAKWRIPGTPIQIYRIDQGPREGEFLFNERTVSVAPHFHRRIEHLPLQTSLPITSWHDTIPQLTGPMIPAAVLGIVPQRLRDSWMGTPKWKVLAVALITILAALLLFVFHRVINRSKTENRVGFLLRRLLTPIAILVVVWSLKDFIEYQITVSGAFSTVVVVMATVFIYTAVVWALWLVTLALFEGIVRARKIPEDSFNAHLWRLAARIIGILAGVVIIGKALQGLGLPLYSVVAGLGIGGLAVALAIRPTLENLIAGILLYLDQPVRVGDFCSFDDKIGTVEAIGVRSTKVRALDRTLITIPNAALADMQLINWAKCDMMLIKTTLGLRYETVNDQLRHVLVKFREMLHAHPKIHSDTVRVRFAAFGQSSLDIDVRVYALTRDWNEFYAIREDVLLRMSDIVKASGSSFAFPSQTLYMGRDDGLDSQRGEGAVKAVESWRKAGKLPFPRLAADRIEQLEGTLDYPPRGSVESGTSDSEVWETSEQLSAEPDEEDESDHKPPLPKGEDNP
jgi:MscS family membrane protein